MHRLVRRRSFLAAAMLTGTGRSLAAGRAEASRCWGRAALTGPRGKEELGDEERCGRHCRRLRRCHLRWRKNRRRGSGDS